MSASRPVLLSVTFLEDVAVGAMFFTAGTTVSMEEGVARGLQHSSVQINGPGSSGSAVLPGSGSFAALSGHPNDNAELASAIANAGSGSAKAPIQITASRALLASDANAVLYTAAGDTNTYALTVPAALGASFGCSFLQLGTNPISCSHGLGVTMAVEGSTAGVNTAMVLSRADATAEVYDLKLPTLVPSKAGTQVYPAVDDTAYMTAKKVADLLGLTPPASYSYTGLSTGTLPSSPVDGQVILLTDTAWGGSGLTTGKGEEFVWVAAKSAWFPKKTIEIVTINSTSGVVGTANATAQFMAQYQLPAILNHPSQHIRFDGIVGKTGTAGNLTYEVRIGNSNSSGVLAMASLVATSTLIKGYFQGDVIFDSTTSFHEISGGNLAATTSALITGTGLTAGSTLWVNMKLTPTSTDTPIVYALNIKLLPFGG